MFKDLCDDFQSLRRGLCDYFVTTLHGWLTLSRLKIISGEGQTREHTTYGLVHRRSIVRSHLHAIEAVELLPFGCSEGGIVSQALLDVRDRKSRGPVILLTLLVMFIVDLIDELEHVRCQLTLVSDLLEMIQRCCHALHGSLAGRLGGRDVFRHIRDGTGAVGVAERNRGLNVAVYSFDLLDALVAVREPCSGAGESGVTLGEELVWESLCHVDEGIRGGRHGKSE